jgi:hypothetical protein
MIVECALKHNVPVLYRTVEVGYKKPPELSLTVLAV